MNVNINFENVKVKDQTTDWFTVKVLMVKGEKGDTGYPTDAQVHTALEDIIETDPSSVHAGVAVYLVENPTVITNEVDQWIADNPGQVKSIIYAILAENPNWTTTVEDNSISPAKLTGALRRSLIIIGDDNHLYAYTEDE